MSLSKEALRSLIESKENQRYRAQREANAWNTGRTKGSHNAIMSRLLVESFDKELTRLYEQLREYDNK